MLIFFPNSCFFCVRFANNCIDVFSVIKVLQSLEGSSPHSSGLTRLLWLAAVDDLLVSDFVDHLLDYSKRNSV